MNDGWYSVSNIIKVGMLKPFGVDTEYKIRLLIKYGVLEVTKLPRTKERGGMRLMVKEKSLREFVSEPYQKLGKVLMAKWLEANAGKQL